MVDCLTAQEKGLTGLRCFYGWQSFQGPGLLRISSLICWTIARPTCQATKPSTQVIWTAAAPAREEFGPLRLGSHHSVVKPSSWAPSLYLRTGKIYSFCVITVHSDSPAAHALIQDNVIK